MSWYKIKFSSVANMRFPTEAQLTKLIDAGIAFSANDNEENVKERNQQKLCLKTYARLSSSLCRGVQWYSRRCEGLSAMEAASPTMW